ncbi:MAG: GNAT family N-acetyltransferase [Acidobacteriaceae bacterium]
MEGSTASSGACLLGFSAGCCRGELAELESIATAVSARGLGIGRALCRRLMEWCREQGAHAIELEVRASSKVALGLYRSLGFAEQGLRRKYYRDPIEDAVLMSADLRTAEVAIGLREE